jgi:hypothetical protein
LLLFKRLKKIYNSLKDPASKKTGDCKNVQPFLLQVPVEKEAKRRKNEKLQTGYEFAADGFDDFGMLGISGFGGDCKR